MFESPFGHENKGPSIKISDDADIVFVSDMFVEDYVGGAELCLLYTSPSPRDS